MLQHPAAEKERFTGEILGEKDDVVEIVERAMKVAVGGDLLEKLIPQLFPTRRDSRWHASFARRDLRH